VSQDRQKTERNCWHQDALYGERGKVSTSSWNESCLSVVSCSVSFAMCALYTSGVSKTKTKRRYHYVTVHYDAKTLTASIPIDDEEFETKPTEQTNVLSKLMSNLLRKTYKSLQNENPINYD